MPSPWKLAALPEYAVIRLMGGCAGLFYTHEAAEAYRAAHCQSGRVAHIALGVCNTALRASEYAGKEII